MHSLTLFFCCLFVFPKHDEALQIQNYNINRKKKKKKKTQGKNDLPHKAYAWLESEEKQPDLIRLRISSD